MRKFFDMDNPFFRTLSRIADLMILNISFIICCIPIFTIGAALTGMYYVTLKMAAGEEGYIFKAFLKSFKQNFRQSTVIWLIALAVGAILGADFLILTNSTGSLVKVLFVLVLATTLIYLMVFIYTFPLLAQFENTITGTLRNAFILAIASFPRTFVMLVITIGSVVLTLWNIYTIMWGLLAWILLGFSLVAYINSHFLKKTFARFIPKEEDTDNPDSWSAEEQLEEISPSESGSEK